MNELQMLQKLIDLAKSTGWRVPKDTSDSLKGIPMNMASSSNLRTQYPLVNDLFYSYEFLNALLSAESKLSDLQIEKSRDAKLSALLDSVSDQLESSRLVYLFNRFCPKAINKRNIQKN